MNYAQHVKGGRAKGKGLEADRFNRHLDNIRGQINKHYLSICDRETYVTAEKVRNAYLGFGKKYITLLETFEAFNDALKARIGVDGSKHTWERYQTVAKHLHSFMQSKYRVSDMVLAELELSFIERFHVYLKTERGLKPLSVCRYLDCLTNVVKIAFNDGNMPRNPFAAYRYSAPATERMFLTEEELKILWAAPLHERLHFVRDMFLFACFTGICHADMRALGWKQFEQDNTGACWVSGNRVKTGAQYVVKLLPAAWSIVEKYRDVGRDNKVFPMTELRATDRALLRIGKACGIESIYLSCRTTHVCHNDMPDERRVAGDTFEDDGSQAHHDHANLHQDHNPYDRPGDDQTGRTDRR